MQLWPSGSSMIQQLYQTGALTRPDLFGKHREYLGGAVQFLPRQAAHKRWQWAASGLACKGHSIKIAFFEDGDEDSKTGAQLETRYSPW